MTDDKIKCSKCGTENKSSDSFCADCGNKLKQNAKSHSEVTQKPLLFQYVIEIILFSIFTLFITTFPLYEIKILMKDIVRQESYTVFQQIYEAVFLSGEGISIILGLIVSFILWNLFKLNRIERRIIEIQKLYENKD